MCQTCNAHVPTNSAYCEECLQAIGFEDDPMATVIE